MKTSMAPRSVQFPNNFYWGASTSGHQVEGRATNDWSEWEQSGARNKALQASGQIERYGYKNFVSGIACDHYNRFKDDFVLAKQLGHNATRFSVEWSRIEPTAGTFDQREIAHYQEVAAFLRDIGIEPFVTLWHWPVPLWLRDKGGWANREAATYFERYCKQVVEALSPHVKFWITLNEPEVYAGNSYLAGIWPPQRRNPLVYLTVLQNLISAHRRVYIAIKSLDRDSMVGIAKANIFFAPLNNNIGNKAIADVADWWWNSYFLNRIERHQDFIGLNHYLRCILNYGFVGKQEGVALSDLGWELCPRSIYHVLHDLGLYKKPIYVTEHGVADAKDNQRARFIVESVFHIGRAIAGGIDVRGYLHWSLLDNFEWDKGFWPRFGLIQIDYNDLARIPRRSSQIYKAICDANGLTEEMAEEYALDFASCV